jgi:hypothetical protein
MLRCFPADVVVCFMNFICIESAFQSQYAPDNFLGLCARIFQEAEVNLDASNDQSLRFMK